jgi:hypothetical protein
MPASPIPCLGTYHGPFKFSEPESQAVRDFVMDRRHRIKGYLAFHSFGNKILYPWGHTSAKTEDWKDLRTFAKVAADAIEQNTHAQKRSFSDFFMTDPIVSKYSVSQQSLQKVPVSKIGSIKNNIRRIFLGDKSSQTKEVTLQSCQYLYQ